MDSDWTPRLNEAADKTIKFQPFKSGISTSSKNKAVASKKNLDAERSGVDGLEVFFLVSLVLTLQFILAAGSYSGAGSPPMFGDYEAQRHWMEITYNLPVNQWYINGTDNDLLYWGLDYPPLTAYHSWIMGVIANRIDPSWVSLGESRGIEQPRHKMFMRISAILPYFLIYLPSLLVVFITDRRKSIEKTKLVAVAALYIGLLAIDCGHFQYNSISLGLFLAAYSGLIRGFTLTGSILFVLAINYKQMELYHALPVFVFILARCIRRPVLSRAVESISSLFCVASVVLLSFAVIWSPFLYQGPAHVMAVLQRIFPFSRGLYEDKVASVWCSFSFLLKLNRFLSLDAQIKLSTACVLASSLPSLGLLFFRPSPRLFRLSLLITSLSFFLFSFQVHEKSVLLPAISALLVLGDHPEAVTWLLHITNTSMFSLFLKDNNGNLLVAIVAYYVLCSVMVPRSSKVSNLCYHASSLGAILICALECFMTPPTHLPHIYPLLNAVYSCCHFLLFLAFFYYQMYKDELFSITTKKKV